MSLRYRSNGCPEAESVLSPDAGPTQDQVLADASKAPGWHAITLQHGHEGSGATAFSQVAFGVAEVATALERQQPPRQVTGTQILKVGNAVMAVVYSTPHHSGQPVAPMGVGEAPTPPNFPGHI
jgi:hypothetical protein